LPKGKFYTCTGDTGTTTRLGSSQRLSKHNLLIQTIGEIDEANCAIGVLRSMAQDPILQQSLPHVQQRLIQIMAHLSATPETRAQHPGLNDEDVTWLETLIGQLEALIPNLQGFVLPGGSTAGAMGHLARAVTRRAERQIVALIEEETDIGEANLAFINRLSSLLFVAAIREDILAKD
jgi:cob(I)alamin adenosyltransferase